MQNYSRRSSRSPSARCGGRDTGQSVAQRKNPPTSGNQPIIPMVMIAASATGQKDRIRRTGFCRAYDLRAEAHDWLGRAVGAAGAPPLSCRWAARPPPRCSSSKSPAAISPSGTCCACSTTGNGSTAEPDLASHEAAALDEAERAGLPAPRLVAYADNDVGFGAPVVLMSFIEGRIELQPRDFGAGWPGSPASLPRSTGTKRTPSPGVFAPG